MFSVIRDAHVEFPEQGEIMNLKRSGLAVLTFFLLVTQIPKSLPADEAALDKPDVPAITSLPRIASAIHDQMQSRNFAAAVASIDAELAKPKAAHADYLLYLNHFFFPASGT